ncbi:MAG: CotH kinase family protein [Propionibacteriaceae bacterium]
MTSDPTPDALPLSEPTSRPSRRKVLTWAGVGVLGAGAVTAGVVGIVERMTATPTPTDTGASVTDGFLTASRLHTLAMTISESDLTTMVSAYTASGEKKWLKIPVTLDGTTYTNVGVRLKGNSSLRQLLGGRSGPGGGATTGSSAPQSLPWLVRLDKYATAQNHEGLRELVVRSSTTSSALNEAVALDMLTAAGLESQKASYLRFSVNGSAQVLRLAVENPAEDWAARVFTGSGTLYKADAEGDYTYRGADSSSYDTAWDIEAGTEDWKPLMSFLDFVNNASDTDFASGLASRLDTAKFATYLAFESLIDNFDDIDGPGNNSMLWWSPAKTSMTLLGWDHNLAFGTMNGGMGGQGQGQQRPGAVPSGMPQGGGLPSGMPVDPGTTIRQGGIGGKANALATRFTTAHSAEIAAAKASLTQSLMTSGKGKASLTTWSALVTSSGLVASDKVTSESAAIAHYLG